MPREIYADVNAGYSLVECNREIDEREAQATKRLTAYGLKKLPLRKTKKIKQITIIQHISPPSNTPLETLQTHLKPWYKTILMDRYIKAVVSLQIKF